jgi:hypothetical protein
MAVTTDSPKSPSSATSTHGPLGAAEVEFVALADATGEGAEEELAVASEAGADADRAGEAAGVCGAHAAATSKTQATNHALR